MNELAKANFDLVCRYLGWGDPSPHGLWFLGLEEGQAAWENADQLQQTYVREFDKGFYRDGEFFIAKNSTEPDATRYDIFKKSKIPHWESKIAAPVSDRRLKWSDYRLSVLWRPGSKVFHANLLPLPKPTWKSWPNQYEAIFGYGSRDFERYRADVRKTRHRWLSLFIVAKSPSAVVCFGKAGWNDFRDLFALNEGDADADSDKYVRFFTKERLILVPFFGNGAMSHRIVDRVVERLTNDWNVRIP